MDAAAIVHNLQYCSIISHGDQKTITQNMDVHQQNQILHAQLMKNCTTEALMNVCDMITAVEGNPKMRKLGNDMKKELKKGIMCCIMDMQPAVKWRSRPLSPCTCALTLRFLYYK